MDAESRSKITAKFLRRACSEPEQRLSRASKFLDPVEDQQDRRLHAPIRILLEAVAGLHEADRRRHDEFAATSLLVAGGKRALAQRIKLVLVETSFEPEQQSVVAVTAVREFGIERRHERGRWKNNRAENSHQPTRRRERKMQRFKSPGSA